MNSTPAAIPVRCVLCFLTHPKFPERIETDLIMTENEAKKIGSQQGLICAGLGIVIAQLIMTAMISSDQNFLKAFLWFTRVNYKLNLFIGVVILLLCGHFYGQFAGKAILIKRQNYILVGFLIGMAVLLTTAFLSSWTGFF